MNVYAIDFRGHYPVGAFAVVVAPSEEEAKRMLDEHLGAHHSLRLEQPDVVLVDTKKPSVLVLSDGDY